MLTDLHIYYIIVTINGIVIVDFPTSYIIIIIIIIIIIVSKITIITQLGFFIPHPILKLNIAKFQNNYRIMILLKTLDLDFLPFHIKATNNNKNRNKNSGAVCVWGNKVVLSAHFLCSIIMYNSHESIIS